MIINGFNGFKGEPILEAILDNSSDAVCGMTGEGRIVFCNTRFLALSDSSSSAQVLLRHVCKVLRLVPERACGPLRESLNQALKKGAPLRMTDLRLQAEGSRLIDIKLDLVPLAGAGPVKALLFLRDLSIEKARESEIIYLSYHDHLTGLFNRRYLLETMERMNNHHNFPLAFIMADMNGLKLMNDIFGHATGDRYLQELANVLRSSLRSDDIAARIGGDEFVILLPRTGEGEAMEVIARIRSRCNAVNTLPIPLSVSFGLSMKDSTGRSGLDVLNEADEMMYKAKLAESQQFRHSAIQFILRKLREEYPHEERHARLLQQLSSRLGARMDLDEAELTLLSEAAYYHDIGKVGMQGKSTFQTIPLTEKDREILKRHAEIGYRILGSSDKTKAYSEIILAHHEHWDGSGFPQGLKGDEIPLASQIILLADIFTRLTSETPSHDAMALDEAYQEIEKRSGTCFNPKLVAALKELLDS